MHFMQDGRMRNLSVGEREEVFLFSFQFFTFSSLHFFFFNFLPLFFHIFFHFPIGVHHFLSAVDLNMPTRRNASYALV